MKANANIVKTSTVLDGNDARQHPLIDFADRWELDGDYIRCRACNRPQQVSWALHDFPHASGCRAEGGEPTPWVTLNSLIIAQLVKAKAPEATE